MVEHGPVDDRHTAVLYRGAVEYLAAVLPFVRDGVRADEAVTVAVPAQNLGLLRDECAAEGFADQIRWIDLGALGNPGRISADVLHPTLNRPSRVVTEVVWPGRSAVEYPACVRHEALVNQVLDGRDLRVLCPYDAAALSPVELADALVTHPAVLERGTSRPSAGYAPGTVLVVYAAAPPEPADAAAMDVGVADLAAARRFASGAAGSFGVQADRLADIALVVTELVTNSIEHGGGRARLRVWADGDRVLCEVFDTGRFTDALAGMRPAPHGQPHGRGLLLVNSLADLVTVHADERGTAIRAHFSRRSG